jgi:D-3-phosphoglycerate dehydrogenase
MPDAGGLPVTFASLEEIYHTADVITIHAPLIEATKHLIDEKAINQMKDGVYIVHAARGGIIDESALLKALETGKVAGAALDVFEVEPPTDELRKKLIAHPKVIGTPHIGASTGEAQERVGVQIVASLKKEIAKII